MRKILVCWFCLLLVHQGQAQDNNTVIINAAKQTESEITAKMYRFPQFVDGKAHYKNGSITQSKFNYSYLTSQILFISPKGDTLELAEAENFDRIEIGTDIFRYYDKKFIRQVTSSMSFNLYVRNFLRYDGKEKKAAYGGYSSTIASQSVSEMYAYSGTGMAKLAVDENIRYVFDQTYYLSGKYGKFYPATKKGAYDLFSKNQKQVKEFLETNKIDFSKKEDLEKLLIYAGTVIK